MNCASCTKRLRAGNTYSWWLASPPPVLNPLSFACKRRDEIDKTSHGRALLAPCSTCTLVAHQWMRVNNQLRKLYFLPRKLIAFGLSAHGSTNGGLRGAAHNPSASADGQPRNELRSMRDPQESAATFDERSTAHFARRSAVIDSHLVWCIVIDTLKCISTHGVCALASKDSRSSQSERLQPSEVNIDLYRVLMHTLGAIRR